MTTMDEQLGELLGYAREQATACNRLARLEHAAETHGPRTGEGRDARRELPRARKDAAHATECAAKARARFLKNWDK